MRADVSFGDETSKAGGAASAPRASGLATNLFSVGAWASKTTTDKKGKKRRKGKVSYDVANAWDAFGLIGVALYSRFEKEDEIDRRMKQAFVDNLDSSLEQTHQEHSLAKDKLEKTLAIAKKEERIPETVIKLRNSRSGSRAKNWLGGLAKQ